VPLLFLVGVGQGALHNGKMWWGFRRGDEAKSPKNVVERRARLDLNPTQHRKSARRRKLRSDQKGAAPRGGVPAKKEVPSSQKAKTSRWPVKASDTSNQNPESKAGRHKAGTQQTAKAKVKTEQSSQKRPKKEAVSAPRQQGGKTDGNASARVLLKERGDKSVIDKKNKKGRESSH